MAAPAAAKDLIERHGALVASVATSLSVVGLNAVQGILLARLLGPAGRGAYSTATFYTQTLLFIGLFGGLFVFARRAAQGGQQLVPLRAAALRYSLLTGVATLGAVCMLAAVALPADKRYLLGLCCLAALLLPADHYRRLLLSIDQGAGNFRRFNVGQLVYAAALPLLLLVGWLWGHVSLEAAVILSVISPILALIGSGLLRDVRVSSPFAERPSLRELVGEGKRYCFSVVADDLFNRLDMLLVLWLASLHVQGYYSAAIPVAGLLCSATSAIALFTFNAGAKPGGFTSPRQFARIAVAVVAFQTVSSLLLAAVVKPVIVLVYGVEFEAASTFALALLPANALYGCSQIAEGYLRGRNCVGPSIRSRVLGAVVMGIGVLALWSQYQVVSIPLALALGQAAVLAWLVVAVAIESGKGASHA